MKQDTKTLVINEQSQDQIKPDKRLYEQALKQYRESRIFLTFLEGKYKRI